MAESDRVKQGKRNRASGLAFERRVRADLESQGWIVSKWQNNVDVVIPTDPKDRGERLVCNVVNSTYGKLIPAKMGRFRTNQGGFPDFIAFRRNMHYVTVGSMDVEVSEEEVRKFRKKFEKYKKLQEDIIAPFPVEITPEHEIIGVESKINGKLDKEEKLKCKWLLDNKIFSKILIAYKEKEKGRVVVKYHEFNN